MSSNSVPPPCDGEGPVLHRTTHDTADGDVSTSVLVALDSLTDFDARESEDLLFDSVDPDALDRLFVRTPDSDRTSGWVTFPIGEYHVAVSAAGDIVIRDADSQPT